MEMRILEYNYKIYKIDAKKIKFPSSSSNGEEKNKKLSLRLLDGKEYNEMPNLVLRKWKKAV
jgi:hypothetical protein